MGISISAKLAYGIEIDAYWDLPMDIYDFIDDLIPWTSNYRYSTSEYSEVIVISTIPIEADQCETTVIDANKLRYTEEDTVFLKAIGRYLGYDNVEPKWILWPQVL